MSSKSSDLPDLALSAQDIAALREAHEPRRLAPAEYVRFLSLFRTSYEQLRVREGPRGSRFRLDAPADLRPPKDPDSPHPLAAAWRPTLREIVRALAEGDYALARGIKSVAPVQPATARQIEASIRTYDETLTPLPHEPWHTSVAQWMGPFWEVLVDLWTTESGRSDLVLSARVFDDGDGFRIEIQSVYVP